MEVCYLCNCGRPEYDLKLSSKSKILYLSLCAKCAADFEAHRDEILSLVNSQRFRLRMLALSLWQPFVCRANRILEKARVKKRFQSAYPAFRSIEWYALRLAEGWHT
ncbi:hypothetical protein MTAT_26600 [Moorella thermoacetica]|uniref:Uncharacterized protein n=1 Tax=Neomoorella thermoacetica TaxID=1525 RepID=A0AAC9HFI7_NEOTH|nr:hypothetical protein Maut_00574 [Moorella thermoacetica]TYL08996.1 hypothetical protein MTAT_26600 [Moorella thermoacetica]